MASISSVGIGSGVLTSDLIDKLASAESEPATLRLDIKEEKLSTQLSDMGRIKSALSDLRISSRVLKNPDATQARAATSSDTAVSITAEDGAPIGTHSVVVTQLAEAHVLSTAFSLSDTNTTSIGTGTLTISDGTTTSNLTIDSSNNTLDGIAQAINGASGLNVTATVINTTGTDYKLMLTSDNTGVNNAITLSVSGDGDGNDIDNAGLSRLANLNMTTNNTALDAQFTFNNISFERSSNTVSDILSDVTLTFNDTTASATIAITQDATAVSDRVEDFVDKYNAFKEIVNEVTEYDAETNEGGSLLGNSSLSLVDRQIRNLFGQVVTGLGSANVRSLTELGISTDKQTGLLSYNSSTFKSVFAASESDVSSLLGENGSTTDSQVSFVSASDESVAGTYSVNVTRLASEGQYVANLDLSAGLTIDPDNDTFKMVVDGVTSNTITLTQGVYATGNDLVTEIQNQLNADTQLSSNAISVTAALDANNFLTFTSSTFGSNSLIKFTDLDTNSAAIFGLQGSYVGDVDVSAGLTVDSNNDSFNVSIDGIASNSITLTAGAYTAVNLATEIETQINADSILSGAGKSVTVSIDANNYIKITSNTSGSTSTVEVTAADADSESELGFQVRAGHGGIDIAGSINGVTATGSGQRLRGATNDNSEGIAIDITGGSTGSRGTVTYVQGVANQMVDLLNSYLQLDGGSITGAIDGYNDQLAEIDEERVALDERVELLTARLARQFTAMDIIISQLKTTEDFLKNQFAALNGLSGQE